MAMPTVNVLAQDSTSRLLSRSVSVSTSFPMSATAEDDSRSFVGIRNVFRYMREMRPPRTMAPARKVKCSCHAVKIWIC